LNGRYKIQCPNFRGRFVQCWCWYLCALCYGLPSIMILFTN
jgi:hypothetical protein